MQFEFATAAKIVFGSGKLNSIGSLIDSFGDKALIISGAPIEISERLVHLLATNKVISSIYKISSEPTIEAVRNAIELLRSTRSNFVIGIGGGSAIDLAKATAVLATNQGDITDYLEVIGLNKPIINPAFPLLAIPTTAGTGSEVTKNAVIEAPAHHVKVSLRSTFLLPQIAMIDPELTISLSPYITAITGLDALTQLIEPFTSNNPNPLVDALCVEGIQHIAQSLAKAYTNGNDLHAREDMSIASLFSGLSLANSKLGAVHGLAGPIGGAIHANHGAICASLLPNVMEANISALINRSPDHPALERYAIVGKLLSGDTAATPETGIQWVRDICSLVKIQPLSSYGLVDPIFDKIIEKSMAASSMKGNPIILNKDELRNILKKST